MKCSLKKAKNALVEEAMDIWNGIRRQRCTIGFLFAAVCVAIVIVGNVILLIALNFWLTVFPTDNLEHNSSQIAIQVVATLLMVLFFTAAAVIFVFVFGAVPVWRALTDRNRMGHPAYRFFLLFASGASNGLSSVTGVYSMSHTPEFIQAVLLCCIPVSAQAWTVLFIPEERKRNYLSLFFLSSVVMLVAGILLSSMTSFLQQSEHAEKASWDWTLVYLLSTVLFGLWCVVQRLYLDSMIVREGCERVEAVEEEEADGAGGKKMKKKYRGLWRRSKTEKSPSRETELEARAVQNCNAKQTREDGAAPREEHEGQSFMEPVRLDGNVDPTAKPQCMGNEDVSAILEVEPSATQQGTREAMSSFSRSDTHPLTELDDGRPAADAEEADEISDEDDDIASAHALLLAEKRSWAKQSVNDNAAKLVLLLGGLFFQLFVSFVVFPVDAIPWFGTSDSVGEAWTGFANSVNFIFRSWFNIRYGLLYTLGYIMSFIGCTFLNEHSPTLASVVLQLAGPITSLVIIIIPQWNVYKDSGNVGHKVGGVILLLVAAFLYHVWEQRSLREMVKRAHETEQLRTNKEDERTLVAAAENENENEVHSQRSQEEKAGGEAVDQQSDDEKAVANTEPAHQV